MATPTQEPIPQQAACFPVPFGHVPYTPALPHAMGPLWQCPCEWWYYVGWAMNENGSKQFTILLETLRINQNQDNTQAVILYGIGYKEPGAETTTFKTNTSFGSVKFLSPTYDSWAISAETSFLSAMSMSCTLTSGVLGLRGAAYNVIFEEKYKDISVCLVLKDNHGMVLEEASGAYNKAGGTDSFEFAMPNLSIQPGSSITIEGVTTQLSRGNIWLDRQTQGKSGETENLTKFAEPGLNLSDALKSLKSLFKPMYVGNWIAITMDNKTQYMFAFFWPQKQNQWIVGSDLDRPVYAIKQYGMEYPSVENWDGNYPTNGVNVLEQNKFNINILNPKDPSNSPSWTSEASTQTYCTAWQLRIRDTMYVLRAVVPGSEVWLGNFFFEGAAEVVRDGVVVGKAFVEQMGYN